LPEGAADVRGEPIIVPTTKQDKGRRALLCVNRASRSGASGADAASNLLRAAGFDLLIADCPERDTLSSCILSHRDDVDCVVLAGGDGTINAAGRALLDLSVPFGILPTGTANDFARSIGVPFDLESAVEVIRGGLTRAVDVGEVNGHVFFNVASVGLAAELAKSLTRDDKRRFGRLSYALSAVRLLSRATPFHATLLLGQEKVMVRTLQIAVGNGRFYGGGNVVASEARIDDAHLDLYSLEFSRVWRMALMIPSFKSGSHGAIREVRTARGASFEVITRRPRPVNADGELVTETPALFTQRPGAVTVYVPPTGGDGLGG
jgi:diacylglycerol kinase (ATP)